MVTSFYIMKIGKSSKNQVFSKHLDFMNEIALNSTCRVCLHTGTIPIFEENPNILKALQHICSIKVNKNDNLPKHLCAICDKFIKSAMIFIAKAQETAKILKLQVKKENCDKPSPALMKTNIKQEPRFYKSMNSVKPEEQNYSPQHSPVPENGTKMVAKAKAAKIQCEICNTVINKSYYSQHMTMHDPNHQKYICDVCGKSFRLRCAYHSHSLRHRSDFQHKCQFCPYKARYKELLKTHMKVHIGDYKYMCTECPTRFLFKSNLNRHLLRHKEPQFSCDVCKRSFHIKLALQRHYEADHLGIKKHVCNICGKAFGYRNAMMKHQRCVHKREKIRFSRMPAYLQTEKNL